MQRQPATPNPLVAPTPAPIPAMVNIDAQWNIATGARPNEGMPPTPRLRTIPLPPVPVAVPARAGTLFNGAFDVNADVAHAVEQSVILTPAIARHWDHPPPPQERMPRTPRLQTIPLPRVPAAVTPRADTRFNVAFDVAVDVEGRVEQGVNSPPARPRPPPPIGPRPPPPAHPRTLPPARPRTPPPARPRPPPPIGPRPPSPACPRPPSPACPRPPPARPRPPPPIGPRPPLPAPLPAAVGQRDYRPQLEERVPGAPWVRTIPLPHVPPVVPSIGPQTTVPAALAGRAADLRPPGAPRMRTVPLPSVPRVVYVEDDGQFNTGEDGGLR